MRNGLTVRSEEQAKKVPKEEKQQLKRCSFVKWLFPCMLLDFVL
jgi:hypothetical protein